MSKRAVLVVNLLYYISLSIVSSSTVAPIPSFQIVEIRKFPVIDQRPYNQLLRESEIRYSYADEKHQLFVRYFAFMNGKIRKAFNAEDRRHVLLDAAERLGAFIDAHIKDLKRLLYVTDQALGAMVTIKRSKRMAVAEDRIRETGALVPFALYTSPEYKCLGDSYFMVSAHNQEDVQMILTSERRPHCYNYKGVFSFLAHERRRAESAYTGPHGEKFKTFDPTRGLFCYFMDPDIDDTNSLCLFRINPREEFPESVEYEPKVSYYCGPYRYFIPTTTDIRCIFSVFSMNFILRFSYDGVDYKTSEMTFMFQNGQVFFTDEPWAGMSCYNWVCKWHHNQNQRGNELANS